LSIALTAGEPAGIGPDLCLQLATEPCAHQRVVIADPDMLAQRASMLGLDIQLDLFDPTQSPQPQQAGQLSVLPVSLASPCVPGQLDPGNARYVLETLRLGGQGCLDGDFAAVVTAPVHKGVINDAGVSFSGHTEFFAEQTGTPKVVMMLACPGLRVALATTHLPLRAVADAITHESLEQVIRILHRDLQTKFGLPAPRILVCGLNPHAGAGGHPGRAELDGIIPPVGRRRGEGTLLVGPPRAGAPGSPKYVGRADAVVAIDPDESPRVLKH